MLQEAANLGVHHQLRQSAGQCSKLIAELEQADRQPVSGGKQDQ